jgi:hypothetical protein
MTQDTFLAVVTELKAHDIAASFEYPGYICIPVGPTLLRFCDTYRTLYGEGIDEESGTLIEAFDSSLPANTEDVQAVADWIKGIYAFAAECVLE